MIKTTLTIEITHDGTYEVPFIGNPAWHIGRAIYRYGEELGRGEVEGDIQLLQVHSILITDKKKENGR